MLISIVILILEQVQLEIHLFWGGGYRRWKEFILFQKNIGIFPYLWKTFLLCKSNLEHLWYIYGILYFAF